MINLKIFNYCDLDKLVEILRNNDGSVVLVGGCFDILHIGHIRFLQKAAEQGNVLVVALESDEKTRQLKGEGRPINTQEVRAEMLSSLEMTDYVLKLAPNLKDSDYLEFTKKINPKILAVTEENEKIRKIGETLGIKYIEVMPLVKDISTSKLARLVGME